MTAPQHTPTPKLDAASKLPRHVIKQVMAEMMDENAKLRTVNAALVEALRELVRLNDDPMSLMPPTPFDAWDKAYTAARAALALAERSAK